MTKDEVLMILFTAYGEEHNTKRLKAYLIYLANVPTELLDHACVKVAQEWEHSALPPVGYILKACKSLYGTKNQNSQLATWAEALEEIEKAMYSTPWGKKPTFSRHEIAKAVQAYGWTNIQESQASDLPTIKAQLRRIYEDICNSQREESKNNFILGKSLNPFQESGMLLDQENPKALPQTKRG